MFLRKGVLKISSKFTGEHLCQSVSSIKFLCNFIEITLQHGCSPVNLLHIFKTPSYKNTSGGLLLFKAGCSTFCLDFEAETFLNVLFTKAAARMCSIKKVLLKILQHSQENTCVRVSSFL